MVMSSRRNRYGGIHSAIIVLYCANNVTFTDCKFHGNRGTAICAYQSTFCINGYNSFINNSATEGGAIALLRNSYMFIQNNTEILFLNNYADNVGGVIFVRIIPVFDFLVCTLTKCSVNLLSPNKFRSDLTANITLNFTNNTGRDGGDIMVNTFIDVYQYITHSGT